MSGGKPGQDLWDLRGGCSAFAADFCLFIPFFQKSTPVCAVRTHSAGPREVYV